MSVNVLKLISTDPQYVPNATVRQRARSLLMSFVPRAKEIDVIVTDEVEFIDQGTNFEQVLCCACGTVLDTAWWKRAMDIAYQTRFTDLSVTMPCCSTASSLNDLHYDWPAGFARFMLVARNPNADVDADKIGMIEKLLECKLRKVWAHY